MSEKQYQQQAELKHYGVIGMHWGVRRAAKGSAGEKRNRTLAEISKVKKAGGEKRWDSAEKEFENRVNKILADSKVKEAAIKASNSPGVVKFLKKLKLDHADGGQIIKAVNDTDKLYSDREKAFSKERKAKLKAAEDRIFDKYQKEADKIFEEKINKLPFPKDLFESVKADKELNNRMIQELLDEELKIEKELNR